MDREKDRVDEFGLVNTGVCLGSVHSFFGYGILGPLSRGTGWFRRTHPPKG